ncbi:DUF3558 domain-containing protein [Antrihabitans sp. YC2-6]|uniref:DUF3558 domain-containing protein n=1 Tax=Antrihabitans sp. YC2-6 TaxID=2799498 RepID=UPI0018F761F4|nr:DUF3558 domain-containing protein [Antrihabitans sp. YC2-6]MBJ8347990.1 DUF3558 domain-containing protein [Antrihabitans sp. YC2-6]
MRKHGRVLAAITLAVLVAGCGGNDGDAQPEDSPRASQKVSPIGPFFGECGSATDDEVAQAFSVPAFSKITRNSVGCVWEVGGSSGPSVSFSWYRGSPIEREATGSDRIGRPPEWIEIQGQKAFVGSIPGELCEVGVQYGDDFFHWSVTVGLSTGFVDTCDVAKKLADLTASRTE